MINKKYTVAIEVSKPPGEVFSHLIQLSKWWPEEYVGDQVKLNSEFIFKIGTEHFSKNKVIELIPNKKVVWLVTESLRKTDNFEWTGTKMIFQLTSAENNTLLEFTYDGVILENEYDRLVQVCDMVIKEKLYNFITDNKEK